MFVYATCRQRDHLILWIPMNILNNCYHKFICIKLKGNIIICGDFNARCGNEADYIASVDDVTERATIDYKKNHYGDILLDFLINSNCVMMNGRCDGNNDYTSISGKGVAVVDYAIVSQEYLHKCSDFCVTRAHHLFNQTDLIGRCNPDHNLSDHPMLSWQYKIDDITCRDDVQNDANLVTIRKHDVSQVTTNFMDGITLDMNINNIRADIDQSYVTFCKIVKAEMDTQLPVKCVRLKEDKQKHSITRAKPWWPDKLTELWNLRCNAERCMGNVDNGRQLFLERQRALDREIRTAKRLYWFQQQQDLIEMKNSPDFWKTMGRVGISQLQVHKIPWEVVNEDQTISIDHRQY